MESFGLALDKDIVRLTATTQDGPLVAALERLSQSIMTNGRALQGLQRFVGEHHAAAQTRFAAFEERLTAGEQQRAGLATAVAALTADLGALRQSAATASALAESARRSKQATDAVSARVDAIEGGQCQGLQDVILGAASDRAEERLQEGLATMARQLADLEKAAGMQLSDAVAGVARVSEEALRTAVSSVEGQFHRALQQHVTTQARNVAMVDTRLSEVGKVLFRHQLRGRDDAANAMLMAMAAVRSQLEEHRHLTEAVFAALCLDPKVCVDLYEMASQKTVSAAAVAAPLMAPLEQLCDVSPHALDGREDDARHEETLDELLARLEPAIVNQPDLLRGRVRGVLRPTQRGVTEKRLPLDETSVFSESWANMSGSGPETAGLSPAAPPEVPLPKTLEAAAADPRVQYFARSPHMLVLRSSVQREIRDRVELLRSEVQHDLVTELLDVQRELKGKVTSNKLADLLLQYRDQQLYTTVKTLVADLNDVRNAKLDAHQFYDALRGKADNKALDAKVDAADLSEHLASIAEHRERLQRDISKGAEKARQTDADLRNLHTYVLSGGGIYAEVAALNDRVMGGPSGVPDLFSPFSATGDRDRRLSEQRRVSSAATSQSPTQAAGAVNAPRPPSAPRTQSMLDTLHLPSRAASEAARAAEEACHGRQLIVPVPQPEKGDPCPRESPEWVAETRQAADFATPKRPATAARAVTPRSTGRVQSASVNHHVGGGPLALPAIHAGPAAIPITESQRAYCEALDLDAAVVVKKLQHASPSVTAASARARRMPK